MRQKLKLFFLSLGLIAFVSGCIKDDMNPEASHSDHFNEGGVNVTYLKRSQIPEHLNKSLNTSPSLKSSGNENVLNTSFGVVYLDNVLKVTTVDGLENYSFFANIDDQNPLTFYNLIVKFNNQQLVEPPFLRRYTMTSTFYASYLQGLEGLETFQGTLEKIYITDTLAIGDLIKSSDGCCPPQDVNPPPGGGSVDPSDPSGPGDPGDGTGGGEPGGGSYQYQCFTVTIVSYCNGGLDHTDPNDPGCSGTIKGATYTSEVCDWVWVQNKSMKSSDCCGDPDGPVGMLPDPLPLVVINLQNLLGYDLTQEQIDWIQKNSENMALAEEALMLREQLTTDYNTSNYPGMNQGYDFNWWSDESFLDNNFSLGFGPGYDEFSNLTLAEKLLIALFPAAALEIRSNRDEATSQTHQLFPHVLNNGNHFHLNDKADAFRHAFFNAINTRDVRAQISSLGPGLLAYDIVRLFGKAHESETLQIHILEKDMDLFNNDVGIVYCLPCFPSTHSNTDISNGILQLLNQGSLNYLSPIYYSNYLPILNTNPFWNNPNTFISADGHHGILSTTQITPTNQ